MAVHDPVDEFVDGLRTKKSAHVPPKVTPSGGMSRYAPPVKGAARGLTRGRVCAIVVVCSFVSCWIGGILTGHWTDNTEDTVQAQPKPSVVTVYRTEPANTQLAAPARVPESCTEAIRNVRRVLKQGSKLASSTDKGLDILSEANQAALRGDTKGMNKASTDLRNLSDDLQGDKVSVLLAYQDIVDGLATCPAS
jgi:hypothetical protein